MPIKQCPHSITDALTDSQTPRLVPLILLLLPRIPPQLATNTVHPILAPPPGRLHSSKGEATGTDGNIIARVELDPLAAIEASPTVGPGVVGHAYPQHDGVGQDDGPEG
jgi:hypothetical protein